MSTVWHYISAFIPTYKNPLLGPQSANKQRLKRKVLGDIAVQQNAPEFLAYFWGTMLKEEVLVFFFHVTKKYEILMYYSEHIDLFEKFCFVKNLFISKRTWLKMLSLHFSVSEFSLGLQQHGCDTCSLNCDVTAYRVHSLAKATSMQRQELTGGGRKAANREPLK